MTTNFVEQYQKLKQQYHVPHLINENKRVLFILESPHIDELLAQAPVSGRSGRSMTKELFPSHTQPLGMKLKEEPDNIMGIINICSIPMQERAYTHPKVVAKYNTDVKNIATPAFLKALEDIRLTPRPQYREEEKNELQAAILNDFKEEIGKLKNQSLLLIPCGKVATTFFNLSGVFSPNWAVLNDIPHPSFNQWHPNHRYASLISDMRLKINDIRWDCSTIGGKSMKPHEKLNIVIDEHDISVSQLAFTLDEDFDYLMNILEGTSDISNELANKLTECFAIPYKHWTT